MLEVIDILNLLPFLITRLDTMSYNQLLFEYILLECVQRVVHYMKEDIVNELK